jgi:hypothetical protein
VPQERRDQCFSSLCFSFSFSSAVSLPLLFLSLSLSLSHLCFFSSYKRMKPDPNPNREFAMTMRSLANKQSKPLSPKWISYVLTRCGSINKATEVKRREERSSMRHRDRKISSVFASSFSLSLSRFLFFSLLISLLSLLSLLFSLLSHSSSLR